MNKAKKIFLLEKKKYIKELERIYSIIPEGRCSGCGNCCFESVGSSYTEAFNIYFFMNDQSLFKEDILRKMLEYYFEIYSMRHKCPFLDKKRQCIIYDVRPLNCRVYGHWTMKDYNDNYNRILSENNKTAKSFRKNADIIIDQKYIDFKIPYCESFKGEILSKPQRNALYDDIIRIDSDFIVSHEIDIEFEDKGVIEHILSILFNIKKLEKIHMDYLKNRDGDLLNKKINRMISIAKYSLKVADTCSGGKNV